MDGTFKVILFAGLLSGCIALLNWLFGWPGISGETLSPWTRRNDAETASRRGLVVNPTALSPVARPGDLRQDRVGQLVKRVLDGMTSEETRRAYSHALQM